jgi:hypothetical protein
MLQRKTNNDDINDNIWSLLLNFFLKIK